MEEETYIELTHEEAMVNIQIYQMMIAEMAVDMLAHTPLGVLGADSVEDLIQKYFDSAKSRLDLGDQNEQ